MNKIIIFDFNRTLFDPDQQSLMPNCLQTLAELESLGFKLHLVSMAAESRLELIKDLGLEKFFDSVTLCEKKTLSLFEQIINAEPIIKAQSFIVGDRVTKELKFGSQLGLNTIWCRNGRFADELPRSMEETPTYTVSGLNQIPLLTQKHPDRIP